MRYLLAVSAALGSILVFLLASASANSTLFARHFPLLLAVNAAAAVGLFGVVGWELRQLWREIRGRVFGSRLKSRLLMMFALMAVVPGVLIYAVSMQFATRSIDSWFDVRVEAALEGGLNLGRSALEYLQSDLADKARKMAAELSDDASQARFDRLREQQGAAAATLFSAGGQVLMTSATAAGKNLPDLPTQAQLRHGRQSKGFGDVEGDSADSLMVRVLVPADGAGQGRILQLLQPVPPTLAQNAESVQNGYRDYQEISLGRLGLKRIYTLTLTLTLMLALLAAIAIAFVLSRLHQLL